MVMPCKHPSTSIMAPGCKSVSSDRPETLWATLLHVAPRMHRQHEMRTQGEMPSCSGKRRFQSGHHQDAHHRQVRCCIPRRGIWNCSKRLKYEAKCLSSIQPLCIWLVCRSTRRDVVQVCVFSRCHHLVGDRCSSFRACHHLFVQ